MPLQFTIAMAPQAFEIPSQFVSFLLLLVCICFCLSVCVCLCLLDMYGNVLLADYANRGKFPSQINNGCSWSAPSICMTSQRVNREKGEGGQPEGV